MARKRNKKKNVQQRIKESEANLASRVRDMTPGGEHFIIKHDAGNEKMSEVLLDFVQPFVVDDNDFEACRNLIYLAVLVWNISLLPPEERVETIEELIATFDEDVKSDAFMAIFQLLARKKKSFADCNRYIFGVDVIDKGDGFHLNVISSLTPD